MPPPSADGAARSQRLAALLSRTGLGDRRAFAELYDETCGLLFGVVLKVQRDRAVAEEVLQEVYVNVWRSAARFDAALSQPMTWLASIARNRAIDSLRRAEHQPHTISASQPDDDGDDDRDLLQHVASEHGDPLALLGEASERMALEHCMQALSSEQKQSIALAFYQGLSHAEVADHLRQPLGTVKSWVRRALQSLKTCLGRAAHEGWA